MLLLQQTSRLILRVLELDTSGREQHTFLQHRKLLALAFQHVAATDLSTIELLQLAKHLPNIGHFGDAGSPI